MVGALGLASTAVGDHVDRVARDARLGLWRDVETEGGVGHEPASRRGTDERRGPPASRPQPNGMSGDPSSSSR